MVEGSRYTQDSGPEDGYRAAALTWDGRYGTTLAQARNWRLMALILAGLLVLQAGAVVWALRQRTDVPYVVVLDERGEVAQLKVAEREYSASEQQIAYHLQQFIQWVRSRPLDVEVFGQNWQQAYAFLSRDAQLKMNAYTLQNPPEEGLGEVARNVRLRNIRLRGANTYEIAWSEEEWQHGQRIGVADYSGSFVVQIEPPTSADAIMKNPLGLYIVEFGWSPDRSVIGG